MWPGEATSTTYTNVSTLTDAETKLADFAPRAKLTSAPVSLRANFRRGYPIRAKELCESRGGRSGLPCP